MTKEYVKDTEDGSNLNESFIILGILYVKRKSKLYRIYLRGKLYIEVKLFITKNFNWTAINSFVKKVKYSWMWN